MLDHQKRIDQYVAEISALYDSVTDSISRRSDRIPYKREVLFSFSDYPEVEKEIDKLIALLTSKIEAAVLNGEKLEWDYANQVNDELVKAAFGSGAAFESTRFARYFNRNEKAREAFIQNTSRFGLSKKVWNLTAQYKQELELALDIGLGDGRSAAALSRDVRKYLREPDRLFRRVRDKHGSLVLSKAAKAYHPGQGTYRSSYKNAMRLTRTTINSAYRTADQVRWEQLDFVVGFEVKRSNNPYNCPVCEALKGKYPKGYVFAGWHPHCRCYMVPILKTEEEMDRDNELIMQGEEPLPDSENTVEQVPPEHKRWIMQNEGKIARATERGTLPYFLRDNPDYSSLDNVLMKDARLSANDFNAISRGIAERTGARVTPVSVKSEKRILEKAIADYNGDVTKVQDVLRNTFIVDNRKRVLLIHEIEKDMQVIRIKRQLATDNPLGYSGTIINARDARGFIVEMQMNSPVMIYGKHKNAEKYLGKELFGKIRELSGLEHGRGHSWYEEWRTMDVVAQKEARGAIARACREYYAALRKIVL